MMTTSNTLTYIPIEQIWIQIKHQSKISPSSHVASCCSTGTLVLTTDWNQRGGAFSNTPIVPVKEPFQIEFDFQVADGTTATNSFTCGWGSLCAHGGNGFALVLSPNRKTSLGSAGSPWGQGYKDISGKSVGIVFSTQRPAVTSRHQYGDEMIAIVRNGYTDQVRNNRHNSEFRILDPNINRNSEF